MNAKEILIKAKAIIATPEKWTQGWWGRDFNGECSPDSGIREATCFCVRGAVAVAAGAEHWSRGFDTHSDRAQADNALEAVAMKKIHPEDGFPFEGAAPFNDYHDTTHADVLNLIDEAIASLENA